MDRARGPLSNGRVQRLPTGSWPQLQPLPRSSFSQSFDAVLEALSRGEPVDLSRLPPPPGENPTQLTLQDLMLPLSLVTWEPPQATST